MLDKDIKEEIIKYLDTIKFGNVRIELNETFDHIDLVTEKRKRFQKKVRRKKLYKKSIPHEG